MRNTRKKVKSLHICKRHLWLDFYKSKRYPFLRDYMYRDSTGNTGYLHY